jgi:hypothetical protein
MARWREHEIFPFIFCVFANTVAGESCISMNLMSFDAIKAQEAVEVIIDVISGSCAVWDQWGFWSTTVSLYFKTFIKKRRRTFKLQHSLSKPISRGHGGNDKFSAATVASVAFRLGMLGNRGADKVRIWPPDSDTPPGKIRTENHPERI